MLKELIITSVRLFWLRLSLVQSSMILN